MQAIARWQPTWKTELIAAVMAHRPGMFVDVGANVGQTLVDFLSAASDAPYIGFEPNPTCSNHLADFISANRLHGCLVVPAALGERNGIATLYSGSDVDSGATMLQQFRPQVTTVPTTICVFRFDDIASALPDERVALMKIDVEGTELEVLRGAERTLEKAAPWIICEVLHRDACADPHSYRNRLASLRGFIGQVGYEILRIIPSADGLSVARLDGVDAFPDQVWGTMSEAQCDYLLIPGGQGAEARALIGFR